MKMKKILVFMLLLFGLSLSSINAALIDNNIFYLSYDDANLSGSNPLDLTGNFAATNTGATTGAIGKINEAFTFGAGDTVVSNTGNIYSNGISISGWFYLDAVATTVLVDKWVGGGNNRDFILQTSTDKFTFIVSTDGVASASATSTMTFSANTWYHIVGTYDNENIRLYVDGTLEATTGTLTGSVHAGTEPITLTGNGENDELGLWNRNLTQTEVTSLYNSDNGFQYPFTIIPPTLTFINISANNVTLINNTFYNDNITFETTILNTTTNGNINHSYSLNGAALVQYATNSLTGSTNLNLSEGFYNISFNAFNNETSVNSTNYSFIVDRTAPVIDVIGNLTQDVYEVNFSTIFNVTDALSGLSSCSINITYLTSVEPDSNFFINCTDTQVFTRAGLYQGDLFAIDNAGNTNSLIINGSINPVSNIFFEDELNVSIPNYNYILVSPLGRIEQQINTNNPVQISPLVNGTIDFGIYNITFSKVGYISQTVQVEINSTNAGQNVTFNINDAEIIVTILDRETGTIVSGPLFQLEFIAAVGLVTNTTTGTKTITNTFFEAGQYQLVSSGENYTTEQLFFEFTNQESLSLTIYTTDTTDLSRGIVEIKVVDKFGKSIVGAIGQALQWDSNTSSYIKVSEGLTAEDGKTLLNIILDTKQYIFQASFEDLSKNTSPQFIPELLNGKEIVISLDLGPTEFEGFLENVNYNINENFINSISNITLDWKTTDGTTVEGCIIYYRVQPSGVKTELSNDCSTGSNNILMVSKQLNSSYYIEAQVGFVIDGGFYSQQEFLYQPLFDISTILEETNLALFILPLLYLVVVLVGMANVFIGAVLLLLVNGLGLWLLPQFITTPVVAFFYFIGVALMLGGSKRK